MANILVFGGAHVDKRGTLSVPFSPGSSHPGAWRIEAGGGAFNAARVLSALGHNVRLIAPRGGDADGEMVSAAAEAAGLIDRPFTFLDRQTPSYTAILDHDGNAIVGLADMELYKLFTPRRLRVRSIRMAIDACDAILMDANLPSDTLRTITSLARERGKFLAALGISPAKVLSLQTSLADIDFLFINSAEAFALTQENTLAGAIRYLQGTGLKGAVVTQGKDEVRAYLGDSETQFFPPPCQTIVDVTGAGDALCGATLSATLRGCALDMALRDGVAAAHITLASNHAFAPEMSERALSAMVGAISQAKLTIHH